MEIELNKKVIASSHIERKWLARLLTLLENDLLDLNLDQFLFLKTKNRYDKVLIQDIVSLESAKNYTFVNTNKQRYIVRATIKKLYDSFPAKLFCRIHKSHVVNILHITSIEHMKVNVIDQEIPIGKSYRETFLRRLRLVK